jgi:hypothetical protein
VTKTNNIAILIHGVSLSLRGSGRLDTRLDTPPISLRHHPGSGLALIGVGGTLAWQSHGDSAKEMVIARVPALAWLLSVSTTKSPAVTATSPDPMQQLEPLASNLDVVRRNVEELATKQDQMAQNIATLQAVEEDIRQRISSTPPSPSQQAAPIPQRKPPQPRAQSSVVQSSSVPRPPPSVTLALIVQDEPEFFAELGSDGIVSQQ